MLFTDMAVCRGLLLAEPPIDGLSNDGRAEVNALLARAERANCLRLARPMNKALM